MKANLKTFNKNIKKHRNFLKKNGYLVVKNVLNKKDFESMESLILNTAKIYINFKKKKISRLDDPDFNKELIKLRKKSKKKFAYFFDTLQTSIASYQLWTNTKIMKIVKKIMACEIDTISATDLLVRIDSPIDSRNKLEWHQDSAYLVEGAEKTIQPAAWIPFLDVNKKNGCMQVVKGGHKSGKIFKHKLESKAGIKDSWYLYIDDAEIKQDDIITCEMKKGSILFLHQLVPHRSLENYSDEVRWSVDLRFQNPLDEAGFHTGLVAPIIMRKASEPDYLPDWDSWFKGYEKEHTKFRGRSEKDEFDSTLEGAWLERWDT